MHLNKKYFQKLYFLKKKVFHHVYLKQIWKSTQRQKPIKSDKQITHKITL